MNLIEQLFNDFNAKYLEEAKSKGIDLGLQTVYTPIDKIEKATGFRFADHITAETKSVAVLFNTEFINYFIKELPKNYINNIKFTFFYDCKFDYEQVQDCIFFSNNKLDIEMISIENIKDLDKVMAGKKFDIVFSNPPYEKNLHLKIMDGMSKISENMIWISPIRWLQNPFSRFNTKSDFVKFKESISEHLFGVTLIPAKRAQQIFENTVMNIDLAIYKWNKKETGKFNYNSISSNSIIEKYIEFSKDNFPIFDENKYEGVRVRIPLITGGNSGGSGNRKSFTGLRTFGKLLYFVDGLKDGKKWFEHYQRNQYSKTSINITRSILFESETYAKNFIEQFSTDFVKFITHFILVDVNVHQYNVIWMNNVINPRTGLKGYEGEWTNEDFYQFFGITEEEQKYIEETMSQFK